MGEEMGIVIDLIEGGTFSLNDFIEVYNHFDHINHRVHILLVPT